MEQWLLEFITRKYYCGACSPQKIEVSSRNNNVGQSSEEWSSKWHRWANMLIITVDHYSPAVEVDDMDGLGVGE